jgi:hypothetical protein
VRKEPVDGSGGRFQHPATSGAVAQVECADYGVASALLGLEGLEVFDVGEGGHNGAREVHVLTAAGVPRLCPHCATPARRPKERVCTVVRDLPQAQTRTELRWHKQRWWCDNPGCARKTFTEAVPQAGPGHRLTERMRTAMAEAVGEQLRPVCEVADTFGVAWHSSHNAFVAHADAVLGRRRLNPTRTATTVGRHDWSDQSQLTVGDLQQSPFAANSDSREEYLPSTGHLDNFGENRDRAHNLPVPILERDRAVGYVTYPQVLVLDPLIPLNLADINFGGFLLDMCPKRINKLPDLDVLIDILVIFIDLRLHVRNGTKVSLRLEPLQEG